MHTAAKADAPPQGRLALALLLGQEEHDVTAVVEVAKVAIVVVAIGMTGDARKTSAHDDCAIGL